MADDSETNEERLGLDIEVVISEGEVTAVYYKGEPVRALVRDYDVAFPCVAHNLAKDDEGNFYMEIIV